MAVRTSLRLLIDRSFIERIGPSGYLIHPGAQVIANELWNEFERHEPSLQAMIDSRTRATLLENVMTDAAGWTLTDT